MLVRWHLPARGRGGLGDVEKSLAAAPLGRHRGICSKCATNVGFPGYATAAMNEVFNTLVIPTMFARVTLDEISPEEAVRVAQAQITRKLERRGPG